VPRARANPKRVEATPEKRFFISMLVKDIELIPAILDLVDNSIDGAKRVRSSRRKKQRFSGLHVRLGLNASRFLIEDNCGGITAAQAREYAFRFGRSADMPGSAGEVGQFGVGMKRALFKLGSEFSVESVAAQSSFVLPVNVRDWEADRSPDWTFEFASVDEQKEHPPDECGTTIRVTDLHASVAQDFESQSFLSRLRAALELRHQDALQQGIELVLNDVALRPVVPLLLSSPDFSPLHLERDFRVNKGKVHMALFAGVDGGQGLEAAGDSETDAESIKQPSRAGWYLFCNDRLLFAADQTPLTGWGSAAAAYHPQDRLFRGYVYLSATDSSLLPWNTTKTGVDEDSDLFRSVQGEMFAALRMVQAVLNRAKDERQDREPDDRPVLAAMAAAPSMPVRDVPTSDTPVAPSDPPRKRQKRQKGKRIAYNVDEGDFNLVADELDTSSAADIGRLTFQYFLDNEVPEET
jgi:hypothetical protein